MGRGGRNALSFKLVDRPWMTSISTPVCRMPIIEVAAARSAEHTVALTPDDVITWGENGDGQCGQGERAERGAVKPRSIKPLQGLHVTQVVCGRFHTLCVTATSQARPPRCRQAVALHVAGLSSLAYRAQDCAKKTIMVQHVR